MRVLNVRIKNWRNFRAAEFECDTDVIYIIGPNAAGKSNLLDVFRFLRDVARPRGGGLQEAIESRGGISKIRCLHARKDTEVLIEIEFLDEETEVKWRYKLGFNLPSSGFSNRFPVVTREGVQTLEGGKWRTRLNRPNANDESDPALLNQTFIEQVSANKDFRVIADYFSDISYVHLVPQLLKFGDQIGGRTIDADPFGQEFMNRIAATRENTRAARLRRIEGVLQQIVPNLEDLRFLKDQITGKPHLEIRFIHHRPHGARQQEEQFSDGTLRLISILWLLQENGGSPMLLEEPELSLNEGVVRQIPRMIDVLTHKMRKSSSRQIFITTHSYALLSNPGIDASGILLIEPSADGSNIRNVSASESLALNAGLSAAEVLLPYVQKLGLSGNLVEGL